MSTKELVAKEIWSMWCYPDDPWGEQVKMAWESAVRAPMWDNRVARAFAVAGAINAIYRNVVVDPDQIAAEAVQSLADSEPDADQIEAMELLRATPYESMFVAYGYHIERHVAMAVENALDAANGGERRLVDRCVPGCGYGGAFCPSCA